VLAKISSAQINACASLQTTCNHRENHVPAQQIPMFSTSEDDSAQREARKILNCLIFPFFGITFQKVDKSLSDLFVFEFFNFASTFSDQNDVQLEQKATSCFVS